MKQAFLFTGFFFYSMLLLAQKQEFGAITYTIPAGYTATKTNEVMTYYKQDKSTGAVCIFFIYGLADAKGTPKQCFDYYWESLVQKPNNTTAVATLQPEATTKGWTFITGNGAYTSNGVATAAMQITFTGANKMQNVLIITNSTSYQNDIESFIAKADVIREAGSGVVQPQQQITTGANTGFDAITTPPTWSMTTSGGKTLLEKNTATGKRVIELMNFIQSSGDLERDMAHIFFEVFDGWELRIPENALLKEADQEKGLTCQGLNYYMVTNSIRKKGPGNFDVIKATVLLIQAGDKVATINSTDNILGSEVEMALHFLLFHLKIKGVAAKPVDYKQQLIGTWASASGTYGNSLNSATSYTAADRFYVMIQSSYTVGYDYYNDLIKKKQFKSEGQFSLTGNVLERRGTSGAASKYYIRFYSRRNGDGSWRQLMSLYDYNYDRQKIDPVFQMQKI